MARGVVRVATSRCGRDELAQHARIACAFEVLSVLDVAVDAAGRFELTERMVPPCVKDYDVGGNRPAEWAARFDVASWALFAAQIDGAHVGGAVVAFDTPGVEMLEGRRDLAVLWDLRVAPEARGQGVGHALFRSAEAWAASRGCREIKVETQHVNVPACRFYARQGCELTAIDPQAYPELPNEIRMIWRKRVVGQRPDRS